VIYRADQLFVAAVTSGKVGLFPIAPGFKIRYLPKEGNGEGL
jgi:hypothetical protein